MSSESCMQEKERKNPATNQTQSSSKLTAYFRYTENLIVFLKTLLVTEGKVSKYMLIRSKLCFSGWYFLSFNGGFFSTIFFKDHRQNFKIFFNGLY